MNYRIYNNIHPISPVIKRQRVNANNMFSKCPRLQVRAHKLNKIYVFMKSCFPDGGGSTSPHTQGLVFFPKRNPFLGISLLISASVLKSVRVPGRCKDRNRCVESDAGEEEILKALEHHETGKTPTHSPSGKNKPPDLPKTPKLAACQGENKSQIFL